MTFATRKELQFLAEYNSKIKRLALANPYLAYFLVIITNNLRVIKFTHFVCQLSTVSRGGFCEIFTGKTDMSLKLACTTVNSQQSTLFLYYFVVPEFNIVVVWNKVSHLFSTTIQRLLRACW
jgi:hypothetical protein